MLYSFNQIDDNKIESLFSTETYDRKNKTNKSDVVITTEQLNKIENGCAIEDLVSLGVPIYQYKTQITIHGVFPDVTTNYIGNYKNLIQNDNKSIGIKYSAIDWSKKSLIINAIKLGGKNVLFNVNSTEFALYVVSEDYKNIETIKSLVALKNDIESVIIGHSDVFITSIYGIKMVVLKVVVNSIKQENLNKVVSLVSVFNSIDEVLKAIEVKKEADRIESEILSKQYDANRKVELENNKKAYNDFVSTRKVATKFENGIFVTYKDDYLKRVFKVCDGKVWMSCESSYSDNSELFVINKRNRKDLIADLKINSFKKMIEKGIVYKF